MIGAGPTEGLHQVALGTTDLDRSTVFYRDTLRLPYVATFDPPGLAFFRLGDVRLLLERSAQPLPGTSVLYLRVADIHGAHAELQHRGVSFDAPPQLVHRDTEGTFGPTGHEEWMAFFSDPDGNRLALACRVAGGAG